MCKAAWGLDADRRPKHLILLKPQGALDGANPQFI